MHQNMPRSVSDPLLCVRPIGGGVESNGCVLSGRLYFRVPVWPVPLSGSLFRCCRAGCARSFGRLTCSAKSFVRTRSNFADLWLWSQR
jgi:hypothetical protein